MDSSTIPVHMLLDLWLRSKNIGQKPSNGAYFAIGAIAFDTSEFLEEAAHSEGGFM
ncbi:MAG: hypothetical protein AB8B86_16530 [Pseudomonadales bacterium]